MKSWVFVVVFGLMLVLVLWLWPPDELRFVAITTDTDVVGTDYRLVLRPDSMTTVELVHTGTGSGTPVTAIEPYLQFAYTTIRANQTTWLLTSQETGGSGDYRLHQLLKLSKDNAKRLGEYTTCGRVRKSQDSQGAVLRFLEPHDFRCGLFSRLRDAVDGERRVVVRLW
jgi:hypothetical protein